MAKTILNVVNVAHRGTLEEQDDPVLWLAASLKSNGAVVSVLLRGAAVGYAVKGQNAQGLRFGEKSQTHPPELDQDVARLVSKGVPVHYVEEDVRERGIASIELVAGVTPVSRTRLADLYHQHDQIWSW